MSVTHKWQVTRNNITKEVSKTITPSDEVAVEAVDVSIPDSSTDKAVAIGGIDVSQVVSVYIHSTQDITLETNDGTTPDDTISLTADVPLIWCTDCPYSNPLTTDVTALYATNASGADAVLNIQVVQDGTP